MYPKFTGDTKLGGAVDSFEGRGALERNLGSLEGFLHPKCRIWT